MPFPAAETVSNEVSKYDLLPAHSTSELLGNHKTVARELDWECVRATLLT
jgi:hypothetical protein